MEYRGYRDLKVYQLSFRLALEIFELSKSPQARRELRSRRPELRSRDPSQPGSRHSERSEESDTQCTTSVQWQLPLVRSFGRFAGRFSSKALPQDDESWSS